MKLKLTNQEAYLLEKGLRQLLYWDWIIQVDAVKSVRSLLRKIREYNREQDATGRRKRARSA